MADVPGTGDPEADAARSAAALGRAVRLVPTPTRAPASHRSTSSPAARSSGPRPVRCPRAARPTTRARTSSSPSDGDERSGSAASCGWGGGARVTRTPKHCLGVYADVRQPGRITVGDAVLLKRRRVLRWRAGLLSVLVLAACGDDAPPRRRRTARRRPPASARPAAAPESFTLVATGDVLIHQDPS